jgi:hypothetical protein
MDFQKKNSPAPASEIKRFLNIGKPRHRRKKSVFMIYLSVFLTARQNGRLTICDPWSQELTIVVLLTSCLFFFEISVAAALHRA